MTTRNRPRDVALTALAGLLASAGASLDAAFLMARAATLSQATRLSLLARAVAEIEEQLGEEMTDAVDHHDDAPAIGTYDPEGE